MSEDSARFAQIIRPALRYCDHCVLNEFEAERTTGIQIVRSEAVDLHAARKAAGGTAKSALELYKLFDRHGIRVWIDGGCGVSF